VWIESAQRAAQLAAERLPSWRITERLAQHATTVIGAAETLRQIDALRAGRILLASTDPVAPLRIELTTHLRASLSELNKRRGDIHANGLEALESNAVWKAAKEADRIGILAQVHLVRPKVEDLGTDEKLLAALDQQSLPARAAEADAVAGRVQSALEIAARLLEPKIRTVTIERATLRSDAEVRGWLERQEKRLLVEVKQGPVLVN